MKTCIITGASRGIGKETALKLKKQGFNVVGTYLNSTDGATKLTELGIDMQRCNSASYGDLELVFNYAKSRYGKIDLVIANAGVAPVQKLLIDATNEEIESTLNVNILGVLYTNKLAVLNMLSNGGVIVNVSSVFGLQGGSCEVAYSTSKAGVFGLTRALAEELDSSNIKVIALALGLVDTDMNSHLSQEDKLEFCKSSGLSFIPTPVDAATEIVKIINGEIENGSVFKIFTK